MNQVEEVKNKVDIVSVIGEHLDLKKAGRNFKANCPFHGEKTPSFIVSPELQRYKCFGCGENGDVFNFLEKYDGLEFYDALKVLAERAGVKLQKRSGSERGEKEKILETIDAALKYYQYFLEKHPEGKKARVYLVKERGLSVDTVKKFGLGFSPDKNKYFESYFRKKGIVAKDLEKAGIAYTRGSSALDRFRGRVIFPLFDHRGQAIGFAGRILPELDTGKLAKYINTPETLVYHKSSVLYGLELTKQEIRKKNQAVVVEGELDMISCYQAGIQNVVAIKGSAFTVEQVKILLRFTDRVVLALDADLAGDKAARRGIKIATDEGLDVRIARLGEHKDPDEAVRSDVDGFRKIIADAIGVYDYLIESACERFDPETGQGKAKISREIVPVLSEISDSIVRAHYVKMLSDKLRVPESAVFAELSEPESGGEEAVESQPQASIDRRDLLEDRLMIIGFAHDASIFKDKEVTPLIKKSMNLKLASEAASYMKDHDELVISEFKDSLPKELLSSFSELMMSEAVFGEVKYEKEKDVVVRELSIYDNKKYRDELSKEIELLEKKGKNDEVEEKQKEFDKTVKKLSVLEASA